MSQPDFSESIRIINDAHSDAVAVLSKWRDLIDYPGNVSVTVKDNGVARTVVLPSIREAIRRYLGGTFEQVTLIADNLSATLRLDTDGNVELVSADEDFAGLVAPKITAARIIGANGVLSVSGDLSVSGKSSVANASFTNLSVTGGQIVNAAFMGTTAITGNTTITGAATIQSATIQHLNAGTLRYRKQVLDWGVEGIVDGGVVAPTENGLWLGQQSALERAGIFEDPTWADCINVPGGIPPSPNTVSIYWGETGNVPLLGISGSPDFAVGFMALWPYKKFEKVGDAFRIRWLPLTDDAGHITYMRTGSAAATFPLYVSVAYNGSAVTAQLRQLEAVGDYHCRRCICDFEPAASISYGTEYHRIYKA